DATATYLIAGVDQKTVVTLRPAPNTREGFEYGFSMDGDGTVPLALAELRGARPYYVAEAHGSLANNRVVGDAVVDLLQKDSTDRLPTERVTARAGAIEFVPEAELRVSPYDARRGTVLSQQELRTLIEEVAAPTAREERPAPQREPTGAPLPVVVPVAAGYQHMFDRVVVGRRRQHRLDLRFALGSITEARTRALALGIFRDVAPAGAGYQHMSDRVVGGRGPQPRPARRSARGTTTEARTRAPALAISRDAAPAGAAAAIAARLDGAITELSRRRMFSGNVGEIF